MLKHCPVSCGVCRDECKDTHNDCPGWATAGQCHDNPGFTLKTCSASCEVCQANACEDKNATQCEVWGEAECLANPGAVMRDCPKTCGVCSVVCTDKEPACRDWANSGECEKNPASMLSLCPQSCGTCHEVRSCARALWPRPRRPPASYAGTPCAPTSLGCAGLLLAARQRRQRISRPAELRGSCVCACAMDTSSSASLRSPRTRCDAGVAMGGAPLPEDPRGDHCRPGRCERGGGGGGG